MSKIYTKGAVEYIAKLADGGLRDGLSMMDKCLSYSEDLTVENIVKALGVADYDEMFFLTDSIITNEVKSVFEVVERIHASGKELKQFVKSYMGFVLDLCKYGCARSFDLIDIPSTYKDRLEQYNSHSYEDFSRILSVVVALNSEIKWDPSPKVAIEARLMMLAEEL